MQRITYADLIASANSRDPTERQRAFKLFQTWVKVSSKISPRDRLTYVERAILNQLFASKGFASPRR
jgi:hypothetical protein